MFTYIELLCRGKTIATALPLADELVARTAGDRSRRRGICLSGRALRLLLRCRARRRDGVRSVGHGSCALGKW